jgi:hypothetical protein
MSFSSRKSEAPAPKPPAPLLGLFVLGGALFSNDYFQTKAAACHSID